MSDYCHVLQEQRTFGVESGLRKCRSLRKYVCSTPPKMLEVRGDDRLESKISNFRG